MENSIPLPILLYISLHKSLDPTQNSIKSTIPAQLLSTLGI
jgi:hypothetical protein